MDNYSVPGQADHTEHIYETMELEERTKNIFTENEYEMVEKEMICSQYAEVQCNNRFPLVLSVTSMVLAVAALIVVLFPTMMWHRTEQTANETVIQERTHSGSLFLEHIFLVRHIASLLHKIKDVKDKPKGQFIASRDRSSPVTMHKRVLPPSRLNNTYEPELAKIHHRILTFNGEDHDTRFELVHGVEVLEDRIKIVHSGFYYIYSSVNFWPDTVDNNDKLLYMSVHKERFNHPLFTGQILKSLHTCGLKCSQNHQTSYTGGVFHLKAGDNLQMCLSVQGIAEFNQEATFFGLFLLSLE